MKQTGLPEGKNNKKYPQHQPVRTRGNSRGFCGPLRLLLPKHEDCSSRAGFSIIELLTVLSIMMFIGSLLTVSVNVTRQKSRDAKRVADLHQIAQALELYMNESPANLYPTVTNNWFDSRPWAASPNDWNSLNTQLSKYITRLPTPPMNGRGDGAMCGNCDEYHYVSRADGKAYALCTYLATNAPAGSQNVSGINIWGPWYCVNVGCASPTLLLDGVCP